MHVKSNLLWLLRSTSVEQQLLCGGWDFVWLGVTPLFSSARSPRLLTTPVVKIFLTPRLPRLYSNIGGHFFNSWLCVTPTVCDKSCAQDAAQFSSEKMIKGTKFLGLIGYSNIFLWLKCRKGKYKSCITFFCFFFLFFRVIPRGTVVTMVQDGPAAGWFNWSLLPDDNSNLFPANKTSSQCHKIREGWPKMKYQPVSLLE